MESNLYQNDSDDESDNNVEFSDDDDIFDGQEFQPVTEQMLTLIMQSGLDDIYTGKLDIFSPFFFVHLSKKR